MKLNVTTKRTLTLLSCLSGVVPQLACSNAKDPGTDGGAHLPALTLTTFNVGLAPGLSPLVAERGAAVVEAIATEAASASAAEPDGLHVLCAQEFWVEEQWSALVGAVARTWPNEIRMPAIPGVGRCSPEELEPLGVCLATNCDVPEAEILVCGQTACAAEVAATSGACLPCVVDNVALGLEQVASVCVNPDAGAADREPALYGGAVDIGLLTNAGVIASGTKELDSYFVRAGVLYAFLDDGTDEDVHVFCTHLGSPLDGIPYQGPHGDYEGEHDAQITQLLEFIDEKTDDGDRVIVLGDLNMGPTVGVLSPEFPEHFARLVPGAGFDAPALVTGGFCTWCSENSWLPDETPSSMIDHVLLRGTHPESPSTGAVFAEPVSIEGLPEPAHRSDHFGARLKFWRSR